MKTVGLMLIFAAALLIGAASGGWTAPGGSLATARDAAGDAAMSVQGKPDEPSPWTARLEALAPGRPMEYFLLAEEVAGDREDPGTFLLARQLYVLAYELDQRLEASKRQPRLAASVCLGLAALARRDEERRWLIALAQSQSDPAGFRPSVTGGAGGPREGTGGIPAEVALEVATVLGFCRAGEGRRAEPILERPGVTDALARLDAASQNVSYSLVSFVNRTLRDWPICPQCRNRRAVPSGGKQGEMTLCDSCRGNPGPKLPLPELIHQLRIESALLRGTQRSWGAQLITDGGAPLRDLDPSELAATYEVDSAKPLWRVGKWSAD